MRKQRCLQCRRHNALAKAEVLISDGHVAYWHHPVVCSWCLLVLSGTLEAFEPESVQTELLPLGRIRALEAV